MKFGVVVGNIVSIFEYKDDYERFTYMMRSMSKIVKLMSPEEWVNNMSQYEYMKNYIEHKYCTVYNNKYFTDQIEEIIEKIESEGTAMSDSAKLLILISKQLLVISEKLDALSEKVDTGLDNIEDRLNSQLEVSVSMDDYVDINTDEIASKICDKIMESLDIDNLL